MTELLKGIKVIELGRIISAPYAAQLLADLGADVIKIEQPGVGDLGREVGPPYLKDRNGNTLPKESCWYLSANRNKRSITVNLAHAEGQAIVRELAATADVFLENYKVGDLARFGLDEVSLRGLNPKLVYCSMSGFGQTGPRSADPGVDIVFQSLGGMMSLTGEPDGGPLRVGMAIGDYVGAMFGVVAMISALYHRDQHSGRGQYIDLGLLDATLAATSHKAQDYLISGKPPLRFGSSSSTTVLTQALRCKDGLIMLQASADDKFRAVCLGAERPDLADDPRFATWQARIVHKTALVEIFERDILPRRTVHEWVQIFMARKIICSPIYDLQQALEDPQPQHRGMTVSVRHPLAGTLRLVANPLRFSDTPIDRYTAPPQLGEHTDEILAGLGLDAARIRSLREDGAV